MGLLFVCRKCDALICHAVVTIISLVFPKTPLLSLLFNHVGYVKFILCLCPCLCISQEVPFSKTGCTSGYKLFPPHESNFI